LDITAISSDLDSTGVRINGVTGGLTGIGTSINNSNTGVTIGPVVVNGIYIESTNYGIYQATPTAFNNFSGNVMIGLPNNVPTAALDITGNVRLRSQASRALVTNSQGVIGNGTIPATQLPTSGVTAGNYALPAITVDIYGRITNAGEYPKLSQKGVGTITIINNLPTTVTFAAPVTPPPPPLNTYQYNVNGNVSIFTPGTHKCDSVVSVTAVSNSTFTMSLSGPSGAIVSSRASAVAGQTISLSVSAYFPVLTIAGYEITITSTSSDGTILCDYSMLSLMVVGIN
jgi:hypothetical protein